MAAPKGNQFAVGLGRPFRDNYSDEECVALGERLLQWMQDCDNDKKCDVVHLSEFFSEKERITADYWYGSLSVRTCFSSYYEAARLWIGKRTLKNRNMNSKYGDRFLPRYYKHDIEDAEQARFERQEDYKAKKKRETDAVDNAELSAKLKTYMSMLTDMQASRAEQRKPIANPDSSSSDEL